MVLYEQALKMPISSIDKIILDLQKMHIENELRIIKIRSEFEDQISRVMTRLDNIEDQIKELETLQLEKDKER